MKSFKNIVIGMEGKVYVLINDSIRIPDICQHFFLNFFSTGSSLASNLPAHNGSAYNYHVI